MPVQHLKAPEQARRDTSPRKINVTSKSPVEDISVVTLIRTDTTLDHSQKAEKVWKGLLKRSQFHFCLQRGGVCMTVRKLRFCRLGSKLALVNIGLCREATSHNQKSLWRAVSLRDDLLAAARKLTAT